MKKLAVVAAVVALVTVVPAHAFNAVVPEPSSFVQLAAGLFVLGGLAFVARTHTSRSEVE